MKTLGPILSLALILAAPANGLMAADCREICQAYVNCVEQSYPGDSTEAQKRSILEGCETGCNSHQDSSNTCYQEADGQNGQVASCDEFSACILQAN